jgi:hypothetical protein
MEQREQESTAALMSGEEECLLCRVTYSIFSTFREMIHRFKDDNGIGAADNLEFEKNGDVYFRGIFLDNFHDYSN